MNNHIIYNNDFVFCPYNHHSSSPPPQRPLRPPSSSFIAPTPVDSSSLPFFHHLPASPYTQFEFDPEILGTFLQQDDRHGDEIVLHARDHHRHHLSSLDLPLNNTVEDHSVDPSETITYMDDSQKNSGSHEPPPQLSKKKSSKRDRHSKINTAKGLRDRRMRLSLDVAKDFFSLQDMLGFDKASKTVEWLLTQAKSEIKKLARSFPLQVSRSLCRDGSMNAPADDHLSRSGSTKEKENDNIGNSSKGMKPAKRKKPRSQSRKPIFRILPKDLRAKARERAKERTKEKMMMKRRSSKEFIMENIDSNWSSFETGEDPGNNNNNKLSPNHQSTTCNNMRMSQEDITNESLTVIDRWSPFSILNHQNQGSASTEHQFTDVHQFLGKPWEFVYNVQNMC